MAAVRTGFYPTVSALIPRSPRSFYSVLQLAPLYFKMSNLSPLPFQFLQHSRVLVSSSTATSHSISTLLPSVNHRISILKPCAMSVLDFHHSSFKLLHAALSLPNWTTATHCYKHQHSQVTMCPKFPGSSCHWYLQIRSHHTCLQEIPLAWHLMKNKL